jgi:hypothetical protein
MLYDIDPFWIYTLGSAIILAYLSMIFWRENLWSRWAEYSVVGLGIGYTLVTTTMRVVDYIAQPLQAGDILVVVPIILGLLAYAQFSRGARWAIRFPLAFISSIGVSIVLTGIPSANFIGPLKSIAVPLTTGNAMDIVNAIIGIVGVITVLSYFTFTREHKGIIGQSANIGRYFIMAAMGAGFGMAFISQGTFLLNVLIYMLRDWLGILVV